MAKLNKSSFCIRPFNSVVIASDGTMTPCCQIHKKKLNLKKKSIEEYWNSSYLSNLREKFYNDERPAECRTCWKEEENGLKSLRLKSNFEYKTIFKNKYKKNLKLIKRDDLQYPEDIEISITNLCNLKCQMCSGRSSSRLLVENNELGFENLKQEDYNLDEETYLKIQKIVQHDLSLLNLRGGEPLFNNKIIRLLELLITKNKAKDIKLHITSNGTVCNDKILNIFSAFKEVRIMLSIEATGIQNNYLRYPSDWNIIEKNILRFKSLKNSYLYINTIVQNLNILYLTTLINFAYNNNIFLNFNKLYTPHYLEFTNLPLDLLEKSYKQLIQIEKNKLINTSNIKEISLYLKNTIENYKFDKKKFNMFTNMIKKRDQYRKISIADYMPEIYNII